MENHHYIDGCDGDTTITSSHNLNISASSEARINHPTTSLPPLPEPIPTHSVLINKKTRHPQIKSADASLQQGISRREYSSHFSPVVLQEGCYFIQLIPTSPKTPSWSQYEGTLRIQRSGGTIIASGDIYKKDVRKAPPPPPLLPVNNGKNTSIPVFPRLDYAHYLRVIHIEGNPETGNILMELEPYHFNHLNQTWSKRSPLIVVLKLSAATNGFHYWRGDILTQSNNVLGYMILTRVSQFLRQAVIEIDRVAAVKSPPIDKKINRWQKVYEKAGWDITVNINDKDVEEPHGQKWSKAELHEVMLKYRQSVDLDQQWLYHLLVVSKLSDGSFGVMFDNTVKGINGIPREGAAVAFYEKFPIDECWGECKGKPLGEFLAPYIRTAIHEIGHAMKLYHPDDLNENYIMQKTKHIAHNAVPQQKFPVNIEWSFSPHDIHLLCHLPDIAIRPGGVPFCTLHNQLPISARDKVIEPNGMELGVSPLLNIVPIGAPVRVNFSLINRSYKLKWVPGSLSMKSGHISGRVIDPSGTVREFATIIHYNNDIKLEELPPGEIRTHSLTLLWGTQGPLFPTSGYYRIFLDFSWDMERTRVCISGNTSVMVSPPKDDKHAWAAQKILSTPDILLSLAIGGDHLSEGNEAIQAALNNEELKKHYKIFEAKRVGQRFFNRKPNLEETFTLIQKDTVMSGAEVIRLLKILRDSAKETGKETIIEMLDIIWQKAKEAGVEKEVQNELEKKMY
jgi:hypothetical protein